MGLRQNTAQPLKLSQLDPSEIQFEEQVQPVQQAAQPLKLSQLNPQEVQFEEQTKQTQPDENLVDRGISFLENLGRRISTDMNAPKSDKAADLVEPKPEPPNETLQDIGTSFQRGVTFGAAPSIAGAGAAAGGFIGSLQAGQDIDAAVDFAKKAFEEARQDQIAKQKLAQERSPVASTVGELGGAVATLPATAARGLVGAAKVGAATGLGEAIGEAESLKEAGEKVAAGAITGTIGSAVTGLASKGGRALGRGIKRAFKGIGGQKAFTKVGESLTGVRGKDIDTFINQTDEINKIIKNVGGDFQEATNIAKEKTLRNLRETIKTTGNEIGKALANVSDEKIVPKSRIINKINSIKSQFDPQLQSDQIKQIDEVVDLINLKGEKLSMRELFNVKELLQDRAKGSFIKNGQPFVPGKKFQRAIKSGLNEARDILDNISPEIKAANKKLSQIHRLEENMNKSLLKVGAPEGAFLAAGSGVNKRNEAALKKLGELTGTDVLGEAKKLSSARAFTDPDLIAKDSTGKTLTRLVTGAGIGGAITALGGGDPTSGAAIGAALTSPAALKKLIQAENLSEKAIKGALDLLTNPKVNTLVSREAAKAGINSEKLKQRLRSALGGKQKGIKGLTEK